MMRGSVRTATVGNGRASATGALVLSVAAAVGTWSPPASAQESIPQAVHRIDGTLRELGRQSRERDRESREMERRQQEFDRKLRELDRKLQEVDRTSRELGRQLEELERTGGVAAAQTGEAASPAPEAVESSLGLERSERRLVQHALASLGHAPGAADGRFGDRTRKAIRRYQAAARAEATGYLTVEQARALVARGEEVARAQARAPGQRFRDCEGRWCPELVVVPAGSFMMGSPAGEKGRSPGEGPVHPVRIAEPFAVGVYEVTFAEWEACRRGGGCAHNPHDRGWGRGGRPVMNVSWGRCEAIRPVVVEGDGRAVSAAERVGVGVRGAGGDADAVSHWRDDFDEPGELRRELHIWFGTQGTISRADGAGRGISAERVRVA